MRLPGIAFVLTVLPPFLPRGAEAVEPGDQPGVISTVAGPVFCQGRGRIDPLSLEAGSVAVDNRNEIFYESGHVGSGTITRTDGYGIPSTIRIAEGVSVKPREKRSERVASFAAKMDSGADGAVFLAVGTRIVQIDEEIRTFAGVSAPAQSPRGGLGDGGPVEGARFRKIHSIATDESGNVYVAETINGGTRIRFVNRSNVSVGFPAGKKAFSIAAGTIDTVAGVGEAERTPGLFDDAPAIRGNLSSFSVKERLIYLSLFPSSPEAGRQNTSLAVLNLNNEAVQAHGVSVGPGEHHILTVVRKSGIGRISAMDVDPSGNVLLAEPTKGRVWRLSNRGSLRPVSGPSGRWFRAPVDVKAGSDGRTYVSDLARGAVWVMSPDAPGRVAPGAGAQRSYLCSENASSNAGAPSTPVRGNGDAIYFATRVPGRLMKIGRHGVVSTILEAVPDDDSPFCNTTARIQNRRRHVSSVAGIAGGPGGGLYLWDPACQRIRYLNLSRTARTVNGMQVARGGLVTVLGDESKAGRPFGFGTGKFASMAADRRGTLYVSDGDHGVILAVDPHGKARNISGAGAELCCPHPGEMLTDGSGLYVSDFDHRVWYMNLSRRPVQIRGVAIPAGQHRPLAGSGEPGFGGDGGPAVKAQLREPAGLALDRMGNLYIADRSEHTVRLVDRSGTLRTVAGTGTAYFNGDGLPGELTGLNEPGALAVDRCGQLLISDEGNYRLRRLHRKSPCG